MSERHFELIANPHAAKGRGTDVMRSALAQLHELGLPAHGVTASSIEDAQSRAQRACEAGSVPVAVGGDGTVRAIAAGAASAGGTIGIVPGGRGNDFARGVGIPQATGEAVRVLAEGRPHPTDCIGVRGAGDPADDEQVVLGNCYVGFDSLSNIAANALPVNLGIFSYSFAALRVAFTMPVLDITLEIDGEPVHYRGSGVAIGNAPYYGGAVAFAPGADPHDGLLDVISFHATNRWSRSAAMLALRNGSHLSRADVQRHTGTRVDVMITPALEAYADGDPVHMTPLSVRVLPGAISVLTD